MLGGELAVKQAAIFDGFLLDGFATVSAGRNLPNCAG
jgi:hypothetical protein